MFSKKLLIPLSCIMIASVAMVSCSKDDNGSSEMEEALADAPKEVATTFEKQFPDAKNVTWSKQTNQNTDYAVINFDRGSTRAAGDTTCFTAILDWLKGNLYLTVQKIDYSELPDAVKTSFEASPYSKSPWEIVWVKKIQRPEDRSLYKIKTYYRMDGVSKWWVTVTYTEKGIPVDMDYDVDDDDEFWEYLVYNIEDKVKEYINSNYSDASLISHEWQNDTLVVSIYTSAGPLTLKFDSSLQYLGQESLDDTFAQILNSLIGELKPSDDVDFKTFFENVKTYLENGHEIVAYDDLPLAVKEGLSKCINFNPQGVLYAEEVSYTPEYPVYVVVDCSKLGNFYIFVVSQDGAVILNESIG